MSKEYEPTPDEIKKYKEIYKQKHLKEKRESDYTGKGPTVPRMFIYQPKVNITYKRFYDW